MPERCVCCGAIIPEGRQVCPNCENAPLREKLVEIYNELEEAGLMVTAGKAATADLLIAKGVTVLQWVPVTERLPVMHKVRYKDCVEPTGYGECFVSDHVLAYCPSGRKFLVVECSRSEENGPLYWTEVTSDITVRPTNWMPLPEPPKGE